MNMAFKWKFFQFLFLSKIRKERLYGKKYTEIMLKIYIYIERENKKKNEKTSNLKESGIEKERTQIHTVMRED